MIYTDERYKKNCGYSELSTQKMKMHDLFTFISFQTCDVIFFYDTQRTILKNLQAALYYMIVHNDHWLSSSKKGKAP